MLSDIYGSFIAWCTSDRQTDPNEWTSETFTADTCSLEIALGGCRLMSARGPFIATTYTIAEKCSMRQMSS
jgi:hypothetical protein